MCHRFITLSRQETEQVAHELVAPGAIASAPAWREGTNSARSETKAFPGSHVGVFVAQDELLAGCAASDDMLLKPHEGKSAGQLELSVTDALWGVSFDWSDKPVINARIEKAVIDGSVWNKIAATGRCIVPAWGFFEPHQRERVQSPRTERFVKRQYLFSDSSGMPLLLAGLFIDGAFAIITTEPNSTVAPVHNRMPLVLAPTQIPLWFSSRWNLLAGCDSVDLVSEPEDRALGTAESDKPAEHVPIQESLFS